MRVEVNHSLRRVHARCAALVEKLCELEGLHPPGLRVCTEGP